MMAISHDMHDLFYAGDPEIILLSGVPLRFSKKLSQI
jgi:hypothetical protein